MSCYLRYQVASRIMKLYYIVVFQLLWAAVIATYASDCGSKVGSFSEVDVSGCNDNSRECVLKRNTNVMLNIIFTTNKQVQSVTAVVHGIVQGVPVPFPLPQPDGCKTTLQCPLRAGTTYNYTTQLPIKKFYPAIPIEVKWELQSEDGEDIVCCEIPARIR